MEHLIFRFLQGGLAHKIYISLENIKRGLTVVFFASRRD